MRFVKSNVGPRFSISFRQGIVANQPVGPEINHFDLQCVCADFDRIDRIDLIDQLNNQDLSVTILAVAQPDSIFSFVYFPPPTTGLMRLSLPISTFKIAGRSLKGALTSFPKNVDHHWPCLSLNSILCPPLCRTR